MEENYFPSVSCRGNAESPPGKPQARKTRLAPAPEKFFQPPAGDYHRRAALALVDGPEADGTMALKADFYLRLLQHLRLIHSPYTGKLPRPDAAAVLAVSFHPARSSAFPRSSRSHHVPPFFHEPFPETYAGHNPQNHPRLRPAKAKNKPLPYFTPQRQFLQVSPHLLPANRLSKSKLAEKITGRRGNS